MRIFRSVCNGVGISESNAFDWHVVYDAELQFMFQIAHGYTMRRPFVVRYLFVF